MEHFLAAPQDGHVRQVDYVELGQLTQTGWILIGVVDHPEVIDVEEPIPFPEVQAEHIKKADSFRYNASGGDPRVATWKKKVLVTTKRYLVRQSSDATHDELVRKLHDAEAEARQEHSIANNMTHEYQRSQEEKTKLVAEHLALAKKYDERGTALFTCQDTKQRLEADMAKIRVAIGESRMKKILAGKDGE
jgi:hypothetical protein